MAEPIVVNTGPLVSFARIGCLDLIGRLPYEFLSPAEVWQELDKGRAAGHPWAAPAWLKKKPLVKPPSPALLAGLDLGEAAVIQLALDLGVRTVDRLGLRRSKGGEPGRSSGHLTPPLIGRSGWPSQTRMICVTSNLISKSFSRL